MFLYIQYVGFSAGREIFLHKKNARSSPSGIKSYNLNVADNLPNTYKNKTADKFFKEHSQELVTFALSLLTYDAKEKEPVLTSS